MLFNSNQTPILMAMAFKSHFFEIKKDKIRIRNITSEDYKDMFESLSRIDNVFLAKEIEENACPEIVENLLKEVHNFKWIESEKAGTNLWGHLTCERKQLIAAGKLWHSKHWGEFSKKNTCNCC